MSDKFFSMIPRSVLTELSSKGASARECFALIALMHHGINEAGEIGVSHSGYAMDSNDVAEYANLSSPSAARMSIKGLRDKGLIARSRSVRMREWSVPVYTIIGRHGRGESESFLDSQFTIVYRDTLRKMVESKLSAREILALLALMSYRSGDEIGVYDGYAMNAYDVSTYAGLKSADSARHALKGLRDKGMIEVSRHVGHRGNATTIYRMACVERQDISENDVTLQYPMSKPIHMPCPNRYGTHVETDMYDMSEPIHTPTGTNSHPKENNMKVVANDQHDYQQFKFVSRFSYPTTVDDVYDFVEGHVFLEGYEDLLYVYDSQHAIDDFFNANSNNDWTLPDGSKIYDWHSMLLAFSRRIGRDMSFNVG